MVEGRVLQILDEYRLVVSLGKDAVHEGQMLLIYSLGDEVKDETGQTLGRLEIVKAKVEVEHVQQEFSTVVSPLLSETVTEETEPDYLSHLTRRMYGDLYGFQYRQRTRVQRRREALNVEEARGVDRTIRVGDLVKPK